jgi:uncharacterized membrane protein
MAKTASFGVMHLGIAFSVSYALSGSLVIAGAITFVEPLVNTVAHYFFDKYWDHPKVRAFAERARANFRAGPRIGNNYHLY